MAGCAAAQRLGYPIIGVARVKLRLLCVLAWAALPALAEAPASIQGSVVDARGGEALANVRVQLVGVALGATTDSSGQFRIAGIPSGNYTVHISTVGYHVVKKEFHLDAGETKEFEVVLSPDTFRQTETVVARPDPFESLRQDSPSALVLAGNDAKNLGSVLADDPLRAVQGLPGVSSNNDFDARFSLRGADYSRIGLFIDGVLLHQPFHMVEGTTVTASGTAFNADMVEEMELYPGAFPSRYGDRNGAVLDVTTRDGNRSGYTFRGEASLSNAGFVGEGPLGKKRKRGSWLVAARKGYLQYILERTFPDNSLAFGMEDLQGRLTYDLTPKNNLTLFVLESYSSLDRSSSRSSLGINSLMEAGYHYTLGNLGWRYSPSDRLLVKNHAAWMRERFNDSNPTSLPISGGYYGEWVWNTDVSWMWNSRAPLEAGFSVRQLRDEGFSNRYLTNAAAPGVLDRFDGTATRTGGYVEQSWLAWSGRVRLNAGGRWDQDSADHVATLSPDASLSVRMARGTLFDLSWGQYVQFPELSVLASILGSSRLLPGRSNQAVAGVEQRLGERTRLRAEYYNRADRDLIFQPTYDPRLLARGAVFTPPAKPLYFNSLRGYARGMEVYLQRSSANRFTGWVSYAYGRTEMRDGVTGDRFPSDFDQRHTVNVYGGFRVRPSVNLSLRWSYGSNFPMPGYLTEVGSLYYLTTVRNQLRLPSYQRADVRINKAWTRNRWKTTLYGEVVNLTSHRNYLFGSFNGFTGSTHQAYLTLDRMFPILPSVGLVVER